jgi:hypothetical protein
VLGHRPGDAGRVCFLERIVADQVRRHLPGQAHDRHGIHQRVGEAGDGIRRAGTGRHQHHANLAGRACIPFGGMDGGLLVPHQDVAELVLLEERVIERKDGAAGIPENNLDTLIHQGPEYDIRASDWFRRHGKRSFLARSTMQK